MAQRRGPSEAGVSEREAEVLAALGEHLTNAEIGARLFISVRTVESHVSSLLRKLQVADRRALAAVRPDPAARVAAPLPSPLTPLVGRVAEKAALAAALRGHRLVTAVGPGGVGKTRLALAVAAALAALFADGVWYVDLVSVVDGPSIAPAVVDALGLGEHAGRSPADTLLDRLAGRETLLVLDNCEHLVDGVVVLLERLLAGSPGLTVLATSRARLLVPFEWVFPVPGLSLDAEDGGPGEAVELFLARAAAGGSTPPAEQAARIAAVCRGLDGMALAIELAAARFASLGLDGLESGLVDRMRLLTGGSRVDVRHRSLRSTLDWSHALLPEPEKAVLRRVSVFAGPFTAAAAEVVAGRPPVPAGAVPSVLARLAEQSLLVAVPGPGGSRYRALETIRQYGADRLDDAGEAAEARSLHLGWCLARSAALEPGSGERGGAWRAAFDVVVDELRAALAWAAAGDPGHRPEAYRLALGLAGLSFTRGWPGESQRRYEQAAGLAADRLAAADALRCAAGAAESRHVGGDALRLRRAAADAAVSAGDRPAAAGDLARTAELINRGPGLLATPPAAGAVAALIAEARALAGDDLAARARLLTAEAFAAGDTDPAGVELVERALTLARRVGDPLIESAALDHLTSVHLNRGDVRAAAATALRRTELLAPIRMTAASALEFFDAYGMADHCAVAAGDLRAARGHAERLRDLPFYRGEGHLATRRLLVVTALAGDWAETVTLAERFREGWELAGRPLAGNLGSGAYAAATVHGLRGDDAARAEWLAVVAALDTPGRSLADLHFGRFFDALLLLHRGRPGAAVRVLRTPPEQVREWYDSVWCPWYAALWAEAAALGGQADAADRIERARGLAAGNPVATAVLDRTAALAAGDRGRLAAAAAALEDAGCRYQ